MKYLFLLVIYLAGLALASCTNHTEGQTKYLEADVKLIDSVEIDQDSVLVSLASSSYLLATNEQHFLSVASYIDRAYANYDTKGNLKESFGRKYIAKDYLLPDAHTPIGIAQHKDTTYLLYPTKEVYVLCNKLIIKKITLQVPNNNTILRGKSFLYIPEQNSFVVSIGRDYKEAKNYFAKNKVLTFIDANTGKVKKQVGAFPKVYQKGKDFTTGFGYVYVHRENDAIYLSYPNFPYLERYNLVGDYEGKIMLVESPNRNTKVYTVEKEFGKLSKKENEEVMRAEPFRGAIGKVPQKEIFYYTFTDMNTNTNVICKYDATTNTFWEGKLPSNGMYVMLPKAGNDYCYVLLLTIDDQSYVYKVSLN